MRWIRWPVLALAVSVAGFMASDGTRALVVGDYVTPQSGQFAGQLGLWAALVSAVGVNPRASGMKAFFALYGLSWLAVAVAYTRGAKWSWGAMMLACVAILWYLPIGTAAGAVMILLLIVQRRRNLFVKALR